MFKINKNTLKRNLTAQQSNQEYHYSLELNEADYEKARDVIFSEIEKLSKGIVPAIYVENTGIGPYDYGDQHAVDKGETHIVCEGNINGRFILTVDVTSVSDPDNRLEIDIIDYCKNNIRQETGDKGLTLWVRMLPEIRRIEQGGKKLLQINLVWEGEK